MKRILVIADQDEDKQLALLKAIELAQATGAAIHVAVLCYESLDFADIEGESTTDHYNPKAQIVQHKEQWWDSFVQQQQSDLEITHEVVWEKYLNKWVASHCAERPYDLIVKTGHRSESLFYTPSDWQLFRESTIPIYIVSPSGLKSQPIVLACVDALSKNKQKRELNKTILAASRKLADQTAATLHACYVIKIPTLVRDLELIDIAAHVRKVKALAVEEAAILLESYGVSPQHFHVEEGAPASVVATIANKTRAQCIVLGSMGRTGIAGKLIGNTAEKVIHYSKANLLVVNPS